MDGRIRPTGRSASKEDHSSATEIRTGQLNSEHNLMHLEIGNDEYEQRGTTSRQKFSDVAETHNFLWHVYKQDLMKLNLQTVKFAADAMRMLNGAKLSVNGLYSIVGVDCLIAAGVNFCSTTALRFADLDTLVPVNARPLQDVRMNPGEGNREERPGRFLTIRAPIGQHAKIFKQKRAPPSHVKERAYPKQVAQEGDVERYGELKFRMDDTIFAAYGKVEMRMAKILVVASSDFVHSSKSLFWTDVIILAATDLDLMQSVSMVIGVQRQTEMNPITIVFAGINDHLHNRVFLSRLREPTTAEDAVWPAKKIF